MNVNAESLQTVVQKVTLLLRLNRFETAERLLMTALDDHGANAPLFNLLGLTYQKQSQFTKAMTQFRSAMDTDPSFVEAGLNLVVTLCDLGKYNEAQELNKKLGKEAPTQKNKRPELELKKLAEFHHAQGLRYEECDLLNEAIGEYRKALTLDDDICETRLALAKILFKSQQPKKAAGELEKLVKQSPEYTPARIWLGITYHKLGRMEEAQTQWSRASATNPEDVEAKAYLNISAQIGPHGFVHPGR